MKLLMAFIFLVLFRSMLLAKKDRRVRPVMVVLAAAVVSVGFLSQRII